MAVSVYSLLLLWNRAIFELAIGQEELDAPEMLWKAYIDFEVTQNEIDNARQLYERLLDRSGHVKVWVSFGQFEFDIGKTQSNTSTSPALDMNFVEVARSVFVRG
jgi:crooked neck